MITTIIPTYQRPQLLRRAIESVLNQTFQNFTLLICDNHSQDETHQVVAEYSTSDHRIVYVRRKENVGAVLNFALALEQVTTPYFSFLCDDDYLLPHFYEIALEGFQKYPEAGFSAGSTLIFDEKGRKIHSASSKPFLAGYFPPQNGINALLSSKVTAPCFPAILFKSSKLTEIGGLDVKSGYAGDAEFTLRYASCSPFIVSKENVAVILRWKQSLSSCSNDVKKSMLHTELITHHFTGNAQERQQVTQQLQTYQLHMIKRTWVRALIAGEVNSALEAKEIFFKEGGKLSVWQMQLLKSAEHSSIARRLLCIYAALRVQFLKMKG